MMINSAKQLNDFTAKVGAQSKDEIVLKLVEKKELITPQMAKLIAPEQFLSLPV